MIKKILLIVGGIIIVGAIAFVVWVATFPELIKSKTAGGYPRCQSQYLTMRDGVKIAVDVWLPDDYDGTEQVPALIEATRYSRGMMFAQKVSFQTKMMIRLGQVPDWYVDYMQLDYESRWANQAGYAVVMIDARGSGASFGNREIEWSPEEVADYSEIVAWIAEQDWSNGKVGAWGTSYPGNTAELIASTGQPAFVATAPRFSDFDPLMGIGMPGGLTADGFLSDWSESNAWLDSTIGTARKVDEDKVGGMLEAAVAGHENQNIYEAMNNIEFRDDEYGQSGMAYEGASPYALKDEIEAGDVPMQVWVSWLDAGTTEGALSRYLTFSNPQQVIIGAWSHGGGVNVDPFMLEPMPTDPYEAAYLNFESVKPQFDQVVDFFDCHLKDVDCGEMESSITYYTLNSGEWKTTKVWPPENVQNETLYFAAGNALVNNVPEEENASDEYTVDFTATTGTANRWMAQMGVAIDLAWDRAEEDAKLLTYTTAPLKADTEITGTPIMNMYLSSSTEDCAFHVYLEDIAPDGKVTYITEGLLRAIHHKLSDEEPPYEETGPYRSYERDDASVLLPGEITEITLALNPTSVLIEEGHSIRVAIAGADADTFNRYPAQGTPVWDMQRNQMYPSSIELPIVQ